MRKITGFPKITLFWRFTMILMIFLLFFMKFDISRYIMNLYAFINILRDMINYIKIRLFIWVTKRPKIALIGVGPCCIALPANCFSTKWGLKGGPGYMVHLGVWRVGQ